MTKAIIFDIGGVLVDLDMGRCINAFQSILGYDKITQLLDHSHQKGIYGDLEAGTISADLFRHMVLAESRPGSQPSDVDRCMAAFLTGMAPGKAEVIKDLAKRYPLYLASNNNPISMLRCRQVLAENGLGKAFKGEFISADMKLMKPSAEYFNAVISGIGAAPEELLFIDDSPANVEGARAVGMQARLFIQGNDLGLLLADC